MSREISHEQALELLPWLVNGTLQDTERGPLERHVRDCLVCRAELRSQRALAALVKDQPTVGWSVERGFDALLARIDAGKERSTVRRPHWWPARVGSPALLAGAGAAAAAVVITVWFAGLGTEPASPGPYSTLTQPAAGTGALVDVVFAPGVSETQMRALLQEIGVTIVAGPSEIGRYTVRAAPGGEAPRDAESLVARLRDDPRVRFVGPSFVTDAGEAPP